MVDEAEPEEIRLDVVKEKVDTVTEKVDVVAGAQHNFRKAAAIICVAFIVALGVNGAVLQRYNADARARDKHALCEGGNTYRRNDLERWKFVLNLVGPARDPEGAAKLHLFETYINRADKIRVC